MNAMIDKEELKTEFEDPMQRIVKYGDTIKASGEADYTDIQQALKTNVEDDFSVASKHFKQSKPMTACGSLID